MPSARSGSRFTLRLRRGFVWWPRRCSQCRRLHLNGRKTCLPMCVPCMEDYISGVSR